MTIRKDPRTGRYYFRTWVRFADGRRERVFGTPGIQGPYHDLPQTKAGAVEAERRAIAKAMTGVAARPLVAPVIPTVLEYVETFMTGYAAAHKSGTRTEKKHRLEKWILPVVGGLQLDEVHQEHVDRIIAAMLAANLSRKSVNNTTSILSSLIGYAVTNKVITDPELTYQIKSQDAELVAATADEVDRLIAAARDPRYVAAILLAADAGFRIGEIRGLEWADVNELGRELSIVWSFDREGVRSETKSWGRRTVPASERLWAALKALERRGPHVFARLDGAPIGYDVVADEMRDIYKRAGIERGMKLWHALRHTFGTELANSGTEIQTIQKLMGHKSIDTTLRYMHTGREQMRAAIKRLAPVGSQRAAEPKAPRK